MTFPVPSFSEFLVLLEQVFSQDESERSLSTQIINYHIENSLYKLLDLCSEVIVSPASKERHVMLSLVLIRKTVSPQLSGIPLQTLKEYWKDSKIDSLRMKLKNALMMCLGMSSVSVRNLSAFVIALIFELEESFALFPILINCLNSEKYQKSWNGALRVLTEIFEMKLDFVIQKCPLEIEALAPLLLSKLEVDGLDQENYLACAKCLKGFIVCMPKVFNSPDRVKSVLRALYICFPRAEKNLFITFHWIMYYLVKIFYERSNEFFDDYIFKMVVLGFENFSNYAYISIDFWHQLAKFEFKLEKKVQYDKRLFHPKFLINRCSAKLVNSMLMCLLDNDPDQLDFEISEIDNESIYFYAMRTLHDLFKANFNDTFYIIAQFINENKNKSISGLIASLYAISAICHPYDNTDFNSFINENLGFVFTCFSSNYNRIIQISFYTLLKIASSFPKLISDPEIFTKILIYSQSNMFRTVEIAGQVFDMLFTITKKLSPSVNSSFFKQYLSIFNIMNQNEVILQSEIVDKPYIFMSFVIRNIEKLTVMDDLKNLLLNKLKCIFFSIQNVPSQEHQVHMTIIHQIGILILIKELIYVLKSQIHFVLPQLLQLILKILNYGPFELVENSISCLSNIFYADNSFSEYRDQILSGLYTAIRYGNPRIIGLASIALGDFFYQIVIPVPQEILKQPLECLYNLLESKNVDYKANFYSNVVLGIGLIIRSQYKLFSHELILRYLNKLFELTRVNINDQRNDETIVLFENVSLGFSSLFKVINENEIDKKFVRSLIKFFQAIYEIKIYKTDKILAVYQMIFDFIDLTGKTYNIHLNCKFIKYLIEEGAKNPNNDVQEKSRKLRDRIKNL